MKTSRNFVKKYALLAIAICFSITIKAQLSGNYVIDQGAGGDYLSLTDAVSDLIGQGVSGPVVFEITDGTYTEQVELKEIAGASVTNTITFQSQSLDSTAVTVRYTGTGSGDNYVFRLDSADNIILKHLTISNAGTSYARSIVFANGANNNEVRNCRLTGLANPSSSTNVAIVYSNDSQDENIIFDNNFFLAGSYAIRLDGVNSGTLSAGTEVTNNMFVNQTYRGIRLLYQDAPIVNDNTFALPQASVQAIQFEYCDNESQVLNNLVNLVNGGYGINIENSDGNVSEKATIANNFVYTGGTTTSYGIVLSTSSYQNVYHNSINVTTAYSTTAALYAANGGNHDIRNNIFSNTGGDGYAMRVNTAGIFDNCDHNDYFSTSNFLAYWVNEQETLSNLRTANFLDANSLNVNPVFAGPVNPHTTTFRLESQGDNTVPITTDYDGELRGASPDIGADEFTGAGTALSGTYTIGGSSPDYSAFVLAVADLNEFGISGPVVFNVRDGNYIEQISLLSIAGSSPTNTITFQSESADATLVELSFNASTTNNYVVELNATDNIIFDNITFSSNNVNDSHVFNLKGNTRNIRISNSIINGTGTTSFDRNAPVYAKDALFNEITIEGSEFSAGYNGIYLNGHNTLRSAGTIIQNNTFSGQVSRGIYIEDNDACIITGNTIDNAANGTWYAIELDDCINSIIVTKNYITSNIDRGGILLDNCDGNSSNRGLVANNMVDIAGTSYAYGIYTLNSSFQDIYNNSVRITSTDPGNGRAYYNAGGSDITVINNIFSNFGGGYAYYSNSGTAINSSDYNNLFTTGSYIGYWNSSNRTSLTDFQNANSMDGNSLDANPGFVSASDLHTTSMFLDDAGLSLTPDITDDFDGEARSGTSDIGADEFSSVLTEMSGTYTIGGTSPDYATFNDAVNDLNLRGISTAVIFNVRTGIYTEQIEIYDITGADAINTITFQSETGDSTDVTLTYAAGIDNNYTVKLSATDYIVFRDMTFAGTNIAYSVVFNLAGNSDFVTITNCIINSIGTGSYPVNSAIFSYGQSLSNLTITNNVFSGGTAGIYIEAYTAPLFLNTKINNNEFYEHWNRSIYIIDHDAPEVIGNIVNNTVNGSFYAIHLKDCPNSSIVTHNHVNPTLGGAGIYFENCDGTSSEKGLLANNFVNIGGTGGANGIYVNGCAYLNVYHNTVKNTSTGTSGNRSFYNQSGSDIDVKNNIFANYGGEYAFSTNNDAAVATSDYNCLYSTGTYIGYIGGSERTDLAAFQVAGGTDANSLSVNPGFVSSSDLHTTTPFLDSAGIPVAEVANDIDGEIRNATHPDIGADEYIAVAVSLSGIYTIGGVSPDYASFTDAVADLNNFGITGPVTFNVRSGSYDEQIVISETSGSSPTDTVVFQSETGNPADVTLSFNGTTAPEDYVVHFNNADFITFKDLSIAASGADIYAKVFYLTGNPIKINILGNTITSSGTSSWVIHGLDGTITEDMLIADNTIIDGKDGIHLNGDNSNFSIGTRIINNIIYGASEKAIYLEDQDGIEIIGNTLGNGENIAHNGIAISDCDNGAIVTGNMLYYGSAQVGINIYYCNANAVNRLLVANNFITIGGANAYGIGCNSTEYLDIYHNSINITSTGSSRCVYTTGGSDISIINNILSNTGDGYAYYINTPAAIVASDNNNFYTTGTNIARWSSDITDLAALQTASTLDGNSISVDPMFISESDLRTLQMLHDDAGTAISSVNTDIFGAPRDASTPSIGAMEFYCETPSFNLSASTVCFGDSTVITDNSTGIFPGSTYEWDFDGDWNYDHVSTTDNETFNYLSSTSGPIRALLVVSQIAGCVDIDTLDFTVIAAPQLDITTVGAYCGNADGEATVSVLGGGSNASFHWSTGATDSIATGLAMGTYTVAVTDASNCVTTDFVTIEDAVQLTITEISGSTCGANDGEAQVSVTGGVSPYIYFWDNGADSETNDSLSPGKHFVNVLDDNGCISIKAFTISISGSGPNISLFGTTNNDCADDRNGTINIGITGGTTPYTINWSNGSTDEDLSGLRAGTYDITVEDADGCVVNESFTINAPPRITVSTLIENASCSANDGRAVVIVSGGVEPYGYEWPSGSFNQIEENLAAGVYAVTVTDNNNCEIITPIVVNNIGAPVVTINSVTGVTCSDTTSGAIDISIAGGMPPFGYEWTPSGLSSQDAIGLSKGIHSVKVTDGNTCFGFAAAQIVEQPPTIQPICMVTVDTTIGMNLIVWERVANLNIEYYNIYKESDQGGMYNVIDILPFSETSVYIDSTADPSIRSWRYKISAVDSCGNESALSNMHKTMHLTSNLGVGGVINLIWDHYQGYTFTTYEVWRNSSAAGWELITTLPNTSFTFTDNSPPSDVLQYQVAAVKTDGDCVPLVITNKANSGPFSRSLSNLEDNRQQSSGGGDNIDISNLVQLSVYPNPYNNFTNISYSLNEFAYVKLDVYDLVGKKVSSLVNEKQVPASYNYRFSGSEIGLSSGIYYLNIEIGNNKVVKKLIEIQ